MNYREWVRGGIEAFVSAVTVYGALEVNRPGFVVAYLPLVLLVALGALASVALLTLSLEPRQHSSRLFIVVQSLSLGAILLGLPIGEAARAGCAVLAAGLLLLL